MKFSDFSNEKYRLNSFSVRIKYQPTVPNSLNSSLSEIGNAELLLRTVLTTEFTVYNFSKNIDEYRFLYVGAYLTDTPIISIARLYIIGLLPSSTILHLNELQTSDYAHIEKIEKDNIRVKATDTKVGIVVYGIK